MQNNNHKEKEVPAIVFDEDIIKEEKKESPIIFDARDKTPEEKLFIILYLIASPEEDEYDQKFSICIGRTETFMEIKERLMNNYSIDIHNSKIITETKQTETETGDKKYYMINYEEAISIYQFMTNVQKFYGEDFNIEDYNTSVPADEDPIVSKSKFYLSKEQREYREMLEDSMRNNEGFLNLMNNISGSNNV